MNNVIKKKKTLAMKIYKMTAAMLRLKTKGRSVYSTSMGSIRPPPLQFTHLIVQLRCKFIEND